MFEYRIANSLEVELRDLIKTRFGFRSGNVTAYRILRDLESSRMMRADIQNSRKYYRAM